MELCCSHRLIQSGFVGFERGSAPRRCEEIPPSHRRLEVAAKKYRSAGGNRAGRGIEVPLHGIIMFLFVNGALLSSSSLLASWRTPHKKRPCRRVAAYGVIALIAQAAGRHEETHASAGTTPRSRQNFLPLGDGREPSRIQERGCRSAVVESPGGILLTPPSKARSHRLR